MFFESPANRARFAMFAKLARELVSVSSFAYKDNNNVSILCFFLIFYNFAKNMHEFCLFVYRGAADMGNLPLSLSL